MLRLYAYVFLVGIALAALTGCEPGPPPPAPATETPLPTPTPLPTATPTPHIAHAGKSAIEIVLELKAFIEGEQDIEIPLGQPNKLAVGGAPPVRLAYRRGLVSGQELTDAGVEAFV